MSQKENETKVKESNSNSKTLNIEGFLLYYRKFVHTFVDQLKNEVKHLDIYIFIYIYTGLLFCPLLIR
jgi:hypothetical protein